MVDYKKKYKFGLGVKGLEFPYLTGHHVLPDIPNNYCTGVNRQDTLMLSSQWQPKEGLYPDIRQ